MVGGILILVVELKLNMPTDDNLAQLFLELLCTCSTIVLSPY